MGAEVWLAGGGHGISGKATPVRAASYGVSSHWQARRMAKCTTGRKGFLIYPSAQPGGAEVDRVRYGIQRLIHRFRPGERQWFDFRDFGFEILGDSQQLPDLFRMFGRHVGNLAGVFRQIEKERPVLLAQVFEKFGGRCELFRCAEFGAAAFEGVPSVEKQLPRTMCHRMWLRVHSMPMEQ